MQTKISKKKHFKRDWYTRLELAKSGMVLFAMVPNSRINSWESWFILNLRKINIDQYCKSSLRGWNNHKQARMTCYNQLMTISFYYIIMQS